MSIVFLVIIGAAAGFLATRLMRVEMDTIPTIMVGVAGALIGTLVVRFLLVIGGMLGGLVGAVLGAMVVIWVVQMLRR